MNHLRKSKLKIRTKNKAYTYKDSPLFNLKSKKRLFDLISTNKQEISQVISRGDENYYEFDHVKEGKKPRKVQAPLDVLATIQTRLASLICRIKTPDYLHSGKKKRSNLSNAKSHVGCSKMLTIDIKAFYESTNEKNVFQFFTKRMECSPDVGEILTKLCVYKKRIPTGSRISMPIAFWANEEMFHELFCVSKKHDVLMTVYVDDVAFSGDQANNRFLSTVKKIVQRYGLQVHPDKIKKYNENSTKIVTGVAILGNSLKVDFKQQKLLSANLKLWELCKEDPLASHLKLSEKIIGRLNAMGAVESKYSDRARSLRNKLKESKKLNETPIVT